jgi:hypothetical protein
MIAGIEFCGSSLHLGDADLLDRIEADGAEPDRVERRRRLEPGDPVPA